jgi:hypothetical protein
LAVNWEASINIVRQHVVRIETPNGYGTGFLAFYNHDATWCGIATAAHVVSHAEEWQQPIKIRNETSADAKFLTATDRIIFVDHSNDSAVVLFVKGDLKLPEIPIGLMPPGQPDSIGIDVGWLGFPNIEPNTLCFFAGTLSARQEARKGYLIDGVAINGVSGGPVFHCPSPEAVQIIGCVSAYHANRATGEALPGLLRAQDVSHFRGISERIRNIDEASAQKREFEEAQKTKVDEEVRAEVPLLKGMADSQEVASEAEAGKGGSAP